MIDKRIGKRVKQCRERLGISQEELAEKTGLTANYISTVERGMSFPRCEKLIILLNGLEVSADAIFCDVLEHSTSYKSSELSEKLASLSPQAQKRILQMVELMIQQETADNGESVMGCVILSRSLFSSLISTEYFISPCYTMYQRHRNSL